MRSKIAVFMCAISFGNQKRVLEGILQGAKQNDADIFVFTCHVNFASSTLLDDGAYSIMLMPDIGQFDGVIIMKNSIQKQDVADALVEKIRRSGVPAVSVEEEIEGMHYVGISNYIAQRNMVEHLFSHHHVRRFKYVTGITKNAEGAQRLQAFLDVMEEAHIPVKEEDVFYGNYIAESGHAAVRSFLKQELPEAIVCANDAMARGVIDELYANGYEVPRDVLVTGFDNDALSRYGKPSLTTADQNQEVIGRLALQIVLKKPRELMHKGVEPGAFYGESCGCASEEDFRFDDIRKIYTKQINAIQQSVDSIKSMSLELAGLDSLEEMCRRMEKYVFASDMNSFYLCISKEDEKKVQIPLAMHHREMIQLGDIPYGTVLPAHVCDTTAPGFYVVTPLSYGETSFGYCIQEGSLFSLESELAYSWVVNVGNAIENIRKIQLMQQMVNTLNSMWMYDTLTNIYNRGGFYHLAEELLVEWKEKNTFCYILFLDLDGLKKINDNLGHEYGDLCIKGMADILSHSLKQEESETKKSICMRYGGDEFVALGECKSSHEAEHMIEVIRQNMQLENQKNESFQLSCSIGYSVYRADEIDKLSTLIEEADKKMYQEKKAKHAERDGNR